MDKDNAIIYLGKNFNYWLTGILSGLITIHLTLTSKADDTSLLGTSILFWITVFSLLWQKRDVISLESNIISSFWGLLVIALVLVKSTSVSGYDPFLRIFPLLSTLGVALLASGFRGLKQYWREFLILCFLVPSPGTLALLIDLSTITAKFTTALLWYVGFEVEQQGVYIYLPTGGVEVYPGCSGIESMLHLLGLAVVFLLMFPTKPIEKLLIPIFALVTAFVVNGVRVAVMTILAASSNPQALEYWHKGDGSLIFSMIAVTSLGLFCFLLIKKDEDEMVNLVE